MAEASGSIADSTTTKMKKTKRKKESKAGTGECMQYECVACVAM
jgi:hypothetical protein